MILAFSAISVVCIMGFLMDNCTKSVTVGSVHSLEPGTHRNTTELDIYIHDPEQVRLFVQQYGDQNPGQGVFSTLWDFTSERFHESTTQLLNLGRANIFANVKLVLYNCWLSVRALGWALRFHPIYSLIYFSVSFLIFSLIGGAICRCAALEYAQDEKPGLVEALTFARENYRSFLSAPLIPLGMILFMAMVIVLIGLTGSIPWIGESVMILLFGVVLILGLLITLTGIGAVAGGLLLFPAIAYEGTTGLDSIGRSFSYVLKRPVWMFYYVFVSIVLGTFFYLILRLLVFLTLRFTYALLGSGMNLLENAGKIEKLWVRPEFLSLLNKAPGGSGSESVAAGVIYFFLLVIIGLLLSYIISYGFSSATIIYALMRKKVDMLEVDQIYRHLQQVKSKK